jgi:hypothetical protein
VKQTERDREDEREGMERHERKEHRKEEHRVANGMKLPDHHGMHEAEHRRK